MRYDVLVIGGGLSGLTAASLLAKRGLHVAVAEKSYNPGGSCGIFKRERMTFDQGSAMLYGFGEKGFNAHRFVFNCLEEPFYVIKHDLLYCVNFKGRRIKFWADPDKFAEELSAVFPEERHNSCRIDARQDIRGILRRTAVGNLAGARKCIEKCPGCYTPEALQKSEENCVMVKDQDGPAALRDIIGFIQRY